MTSAVSVDIDGAAKATGVSAATIRRAIRTTDPASYPPPLHAKKAGGGPRGKYIIPVAELDRWVQSLPDA